MPQHRDDPYLNFNFRVEIDGLEVAGFSEAQLPEGRIEVVAYREGTDKTSAARLLPGRVELGPVVLRRGFAGDPALFQWWNDVAQGNVARRNLGIVLLDEQRKRGGAVADPQGLAEQVGRPRAARAGQRGGDRDARALARGHRDSPKP